jgi:hypothetical protein
MVPQATLSHAKIANNGTNVHSTRIAMPPLIFDTLDYTH